MKLTAFLLVAPALLAAALPTGDVLSEVEKREASPIAEAEPIYYSRRHSQLVSTVLDEQFHVPSSFNVHLLTTFPPQSSVPDTSLPSARPRPRPTLFSTVRS